jgi:hypothetical protein
MMSAAASPFRDDDERAVEPALPEYADQAGADDSGNADPQRDHTGNLWKSDGGGSGSIMGACVMSLPYLQGANRASRSWRL